MKIPVLIEPIADDGFRATGGTPFEVTAQGTTREEALARLREAIDRLIDMFR
jgi:predicted RNase H-like HicB family nuclease